MHRLLLRLARMRPGIRRPRWRFRKYDVAPRLGWHPVERRLRRTLRLTNVTLDSPV